LVQSNVLVDRVGGNCASRAKPLMLITLPNGNAASRVSLVQ